MSAKEQSLPNAKARQINELLEKLDLLGGASDKEGLSFALNVKPHSVKNPLKAAEILGFVSISDKNVNLTEIGQKFLDGNPDERKATFREQMIKIEPFATISKALEKEISREIVLRLVKSKIKAARKWKPSTDREMLNIIINWGTYSELFEFDPKSKKLLPKR
jgi:NitT/TauT family transport system ATP-binding protein